MTATFLWCALAVCAGPPSKSFSSEQNHRQLLDRLSQAPARPSAAAASSTTSATEPTPPTRDLSDKELMAQLESAPWVLRPPVSDPPLEYRSPWHHPAITEILARLSVSAESAELWQERLIQRLHRGGPDGRFHAAVILAYAGSPAGLEELSRQLLDEDVEIPARAEAACALARFPHALDAGRLKGLLEGWLAETGGNKWKLRAGMRSVSERDEPLFASVAFAMIAARRAAPGYDPAADETVSHLAQSPQPTFRRLAASSFSARPWEKLPPLLERLLEDADPAVRQAALSALATHPTPATQAWAMRMSNDLDVGVVADAVEVLSARPTPAVTGRLDELSRHSSARVRESAVRAAGKIGHDAVVLEATADPQASVRVVAAQALGNLNTPGAVVALERLLKEDRSSPVQSAALNSIAQKPWGMAIPIFLSALESPSARTRQESAQRLLEVVERSISSREGTPSLETFRQALLAYRPIDSPEARAMQMAPIRSAWDLVDLSNTTVQATSAKGSEAEDVREEVRGLVRESLLADRGLAHPERWAKLQPTLLEIEQSILAEDVLPSEAFLRNVLTPRDSAYEILSRGKQCTASDVTSLVARFDRRPMSVLQGILVAAMVEKDGLRDVWLRLVPRAIDALTEVSGSQAESRAVQAARNRLVKLGVRHSDEMVRESICRTLEKHPELAPSQGLAELMNDSSERVRRAAIRAAGATADGETSASLQEALKSPSVSIQIEAASQLLASGEVQGFETLRRLSASPDDEVRRRVVDELVKHPVVDREGTLRVLTQMLSDAKLSIRQRAVAGLEEVVGPTLSSTDRPLGSADRRSGDGTRQPVFTEEQVSRWKRTMASYFSPQESEEKLRRMEMLRKTQESISTLPVAN